MSFNDYTCIKGVIVQPISSYNSSIFYIENELYIFPEETDIEMSFYSLIDLVHVYNKPLHHLPIGLELYFNNGETLLIEFTTKKQKESVFLF